MKLKEIETYKYKYGKHTVEVEEGYQGGWNVYVDGDKAGYFEVDNFKCFENIPEEYFEEFGDDKTAEWLWTNGVLEDELDIKGWEEFNETIEEIVESYL